ncbi:MAG: pyrroline-5-carboxylate reductase [Armatimonadetes bacterium]|nr:pyrroline-5-carboxylate reductase [Armatimonadota bacterium]
MMAAQWKLGIIGSGKMAEALLRGWLRARRFAREDVVASDAEADRRKLFAEKLRVGATVDNDAVARHAEVLLIAVKPQVLERACRPVAEEVRQNALILSIAAGVRLGKLEAIFGTERAIVRVMPNILHTVGEGVAALCANGAATQEQLDYTLDLFRALGVAERVEERLMDAVTGLSGSGPAFVFLFLEALIDGAVAAGLPRDLALPFAAQTTLGAAKWVRQGKYPAELKDLVTSPGGTTIAGLRAAEAGGLRSAVMEAVIAAARRSEELGRPS